MQAGRLSLLSSLNESLEKGINENCEKYEGVSLWADSCFPTSDLLEQSLIFKIPNKIKSYQNTSFYNNDNYAVNIRLDHSSITLFGRGYSLMNYDLEMPSSPVKGNPNIGPNLLQGSQEYSQIDSVISQKKQPITPCPPPQRPLPKHYLDAFSKYQDMIYAAGIDCSIDDQRNKFWN